MSYPPIKSFVLDAQKDYVIGTVGSYKYPQHMFGQEIRTLSFIYTLLS